MQVRHVIGLILFLAAVPLQMYLMKYNQHFKDLVLEIVKNLPDGLLQLSNFVAGYVWVAKNYLHSSYLDLSESFEDDSIEDLEIPDNLIRNFRPPHLEFRIGNVILMHTMIPGIIVGWNIDITMNLSKPRLKPNSVPFKLVDSKLVNKSHDNDCINVEDLTKEPEYLILTEFQEEIIKIDQDKIIIQLENIKITHKDMDKYFESFDGIKYIPKKLLQRMYPKD